MTDQRFPATAPENDLTDLLRQCVQCGLCLPHCATWLATGNEVHSPRGRLVLLEKVVNRDGQAPSEGAGSFMEAFDQCIGCRACETACPSGVPFTLLEQGQAWAAAWFDSRPGSATPAVSSSVLRRLDSPGFLSLISRAAGWTRGLARALAGKDWRRRLDGGRSGRLVRLLGSLPESPRSDKKLLELLDSLCGFTEVTSGLLNPTGALGPQVAFFRGCANAGLLDGSSRRLRDLLSAVGCRIEEPAHQDCCGALAAHTGRPGRAAQLKSQNRAAFVNALGNRATILVEAAGCGHELKKYGGDFTPAVADASVFLAGLDLPSLGHVPLRVVYHDPCHARHGQGIVAEPRALLASIPGLEPVEPAEPDVCCGSGGAWGLRYPDLSEDLGRRKAADLAATGADLIVTANPGCLGQIADALRCEGSELPILPLTDLLWYAACRGQQKRAG